MQHPRMWTLAASFAVVLAAASVLSPTSARAETYDSDDSDNVLRLYFTPFHAVGKVLEYGIARPVHFVTSRPKARYIFGRTSQPRTDDYWGDWDLYQRYNN